jgi:TPR repeat protein
MGATSEASGSLRHSPSKLTALPDPLDSLVKFAKPPLELARVKHKLVTLFSLFLIALSDPAQAQAPDFLIERAEAGTPDAQYELGRAYEDGVYGDPDLAQALAWMTRAAERGHQRAQEKLEQHYTELAYRDAVPIGEMAQAEVWLTHAAAKGSPEAQYIAAVFFHEHVSGADGATKAFKWTEAAAQGGHRPAMRLLGILYAAGKGVPQNDAQAEHWFTRFAVLSDDPVAYTSIGREFQTGDEVPKDLAVAARWFTEAAERGSGEGMLFLGLAYGLGDGVSKDDAQAYFWLILAAARDAQYAATRDLVRARLTTEQIRSVQERAAEWVPLGAGR